MHREKLIPDVRKGPANFRWFTTYAYITSTIEMEFHKNLSIISFFIDVKRLLQMQNVFVF